MNFHQLQHEVGTWSRKNFPDNKPYQPLLGALEELGELAHAHLKMEQGIRDTEDHQANKEDAVADVIIYLADYCSRNDIQMGIAVDKAWRQVQQRDWQANPSDAHEKSSVSLEPAGSFEEECEGIAMAIRGGPYIGMEKLDPEGDYEDALALAIALHPLLIGLCWNPPAHDAGATDARS